MAQPYLRLAGVAKRFGGFTALRDIDLTIDKGEFVCFLGPSGCGKTTLLRIIAGLEVQTTGRVEQAGRDISLLPPSQRDYGIVFQSYALFPNLSVADNVAYGLVNRKVPRAQARQRVAELLKLVGLPGSEGKYPAQLSGGQQQRIALARALATAPGLLLLDEPLSALDAIVRLHLRQELRSLQRELGVTTIMVTHDQEEALALADRIVVMNHGVIEQVGVPMHVYREPANPFVADFVGRVNVLPVVAEAGGVRLGTLRFECPHGLPAGTEARVYLRPEDVRALPAGGEAAQAFDAVIDKVEFLGAYCLVQVRAQALGGHPLSVVLALQFLAEHRLAPGGRLPLTLMAERMRVFA
jgi:iron(III) transport system ATP-binding protein